MKTWRDQSNIVIGRAIEAGRVNGEDMAAIRARVDAAYPFGERKYHPYKQWLSARRQAFFQHGLMTEKEKAQMAKPKPIPVDQEMMSWTELNKP